MSGYDTNVDYCIIELIPRNLNKKSDIISFKSPIFMFQSSACRLNITYGFPINERKLFKVYFDTPPLMLSRFYITACVFKGSHSVWYPKKAILVPIEFIWTTSLADIEKKIPGAKRWNVSFRFIFQTEYDHNRKNSESKSMQTCSYLGAVTPVESLSEDLSKLLDTDVKHDAEIRCADHSIKVHQVILSARSEVFKKMLESDMLEGRTGIVEIKDMDIHYVQDFVRYLYAGTLPELTFDKAKVYYEAGDKYAIRSLMLRCSDYLQENLALTNVFQSFLLADAHSDEKLKDGIKSYMVEKKLYLQDELWLPFSESFPKIALEVYRLSYKRKISEVEDQ